YIMPTADARDTWMSTGQHVAAEGRCFVLSCHQYTTKDMFPDYITKREEFADWPNELTRGGSCIARPVGEVSAEPVGDRERLSDGDQELAQARGAGRG